MLDKVETLCPPGKTRVSWQSVPSWMHRGECGERGRSPRSDRTRLGRAWRRRDNYCIASWQQETPTEPDHHSGIIHPRALLLWSRCTAIALRKHRRSKLPTSRLRHRLLHILSSYGPPKSPTLSSLMSLQTSWACKDASRLWMLIVLAVDVLNVMPFTITVPIMQPSARVRAPVSTMVSCVN